MNREIKELIGLWRGEIELNNSKWIADLNIRHPEVSFFTIYANGKTHFEWQAKPTLEWRKNNTWRIVLNESLKPINKMDPQYSNISIWQFGDESIVMELGNGDLLTLKKL